MRSGCGLARHLPALALTLMLAACGTAAAPSPSLQPTAGGPPPAPTDVPSPTSTAAATATPVPTNTAPPTPTALPDTPTPAPTATRRPTATPRATATRVPAPGYPPNPSERLSALRSYHLELSVTSGSFAYSVSGDEAGSSYHLTVVSPLAPPLELYDVAGRHYAGSSGVFVETGPAAQPQAGVVASAQTFAQGWFDHPDGVRFVGYSTVNGVRAEHFALTWRAGRQATLGSLTATTVNPTTGDVWLDEANGALIRASFDMRVGGTGGVSSVATRLNVTNIDVPVHIVAPPVLKAASLG